jgi:hypothetical protein
MSQKTIFHIVGGGTLLAFVTLVAQIRHFAQSQLFGAETWDVQITDGVPLIYGTIEFVYSILNAAASLAHTLYGYPVIGISAGVALIAVAAVVCKGIRVEAAVAAATLVAAIATFSYFEAPWLYINKVAGDHAFHADQLFDAGNRVQVRAAELWQCVVCSRIGDLQPTLCPANVKKAAAAERLTKLFGWNILAVAVLVIIAAVYWLARGKLLDDTALPVASRAVVAVTAYLGIVAIALDVYGAAYVNGKSQMTTKLKCFQQVKDGQSYDTAYKIAGTDKKTTLIYGIDDIIVFPPAEAKNAPSLNECTCSEPDALTFLLQKSWELHKSEPIAPPVVRPPLTPAKGDNQACAERSSPSRSS